MGLSFGTHAIYCGNTDHISSQCCNRPWHNREQPHSTLEALSNQEFQNVNREILGNNNRNTGFQAQNIQGQTSQPHLQRSYSEISGNSSSHCLNNDSNSYFSRGNQNCYDSAHRRNTSAHPGRQSTRGDQHNQYSNQYHSNFRNYGYNHQSGAQSHARFDERYNQQYSPTIYPPTPSLNSSFPEALSKSLLQIAENQSRTIEAMKASQEAQAEAYKEMSRTNKMRDDDTLFNSIEFMMDPTPPIASQVGTSGKNY